MNIYITGDWKFEGGRKKVQEPELMKSLVHKNRSGDCSMS